MRRPARGPAAGSAVLALLLALAGCTTGSSQDPPADPADVFTASTRGYLYEWLHDFRFPLQPDPHAAYSYVVPKVADASVGYEISGEFPYAAWTEWMVYTALGKGATPCSVVKDSAITPDEGSVNPFVVGTPVLSPQRSFHLLVLPDGTAQSSVAPSLRDVPAANVLTSPTDGPSFVLANRVYNAFPGQPRRPRLTGSFREVRSASPSQGRTRS